MAKPDQMPDGGKFRATAAAALDGETGAFGDDDLLCVTFDGSGELIAASADDAVGVIYTPEGRRDTGNAAIDVKEVIGGKRYTVIRRGEYVEMEQGSSPPSAGDALYAGASGAVAATATGSIFIGWIDNSGSRLIVDVNGMPVGA